MPAENCGKYRVVPVRCLPEREWPRGDREAWQRARHRGSLLDEGGLASRWAGSTQATSERSYGRWLAFLVSLRMLDPSEPPAERVSKERIEAYLADLRAHGNASGTIHIRILHLSRMLAVMAPGGCPTWLDPILRMLHASVQPSRDDRARLVPAEILLEVAFSLMDRAEADSSLSPRLRAVMYRDGLMLAILVSNALRVGNFADLELGRSFVQRGDDWWIMFEASEVKNRKPINHPVAAELTPRIDQYLKVWRPIISVLPGEQHAPIFRDTGFLWVGRYGGRFSRKKVSKRIGEITLRELGKALYPHLFRKLMPTELAIHDPAHVGASQAGLGHTSYNTTQQSYNLGRSLDAARRVQAALAALRADKPNPKRPLKSTRETNPCVPSFTPDTAPTFSERPRSRTRSGSAGSGSIRRAGSRLRPILTPPAAGLAG